MAMMESFLVKLGFNIDQASSKHFKDTMEHGIRQVNEFRLALLGLAVGVEESVRRTMRSFTQLYQTSVLTGAPVKALSDLRYGFEEIGISAGQTDNQVAKLSETLRTAGQGEFLRGFVGNVKDGGEALKSLVEQYHNALVAGGGEEGTGSLANTLKIRFEKIQGLDFETMVRAPAKNFEIWKEGMETRARVARQFYGGDANAEQKIASDARKATSAWNEFTLTITTGINKFVADNLDTIKWIFDQTLKWFWVFYNDIKRGDWRQLGRDVWELLSSGLGSISDWLAKQMEAFAAWVGSFDWASVGHTLGTLLMLGLGLEIQNTDLQTPLIKAFGDLAKAGWRIGQAIGDGISNAIEEQLPWLKTIEDFLNRQAGIKPREGPGVPQAPASTSGPGFRAAPEIHPPGWGDLPEMGLWNWVKGRLGFQRGGVVPANLHAGEMVLPANISMGLQQLFSRSPAGGSSFGGGDLFEEFSKWWSGDASYRPFVDLAVNVYDRLEDMLLGVFDQVLKAMGHEEGLFGGGAGGGGGGAGKGGGGGAGGGGGGGSANVPTLAKGPAVQQAMDYFVSQGWSKEQAAGIVSNLVTESNLRPGISGDSGQAYGIGQWHPDRQAKFQERFGHSIRNSTYAEQLAFVQWELKNSERRAGQELAAATSGYGAGGVVSRRYERPRDVFRNMELRGRLAEKLASEYKPGGTAVAEAPAATPTAATPTAATPAAATTGRVLSQKEQYDADITAGRRPAFPPGQRFNSRGEAISASIGHETAQERTNIAASMAAIKRGMQEFGRRHGEPLGARARGGPTTVNHNTTMIIHGAHDPAATARHAVDELHRRARTRNGRAVAT